MPIVIKTMFSELSAWLGWCYLRFIAGRLCCEQGASLRRRFCHRHFPIGFDPPEGFVELKEKLPRAILAKWANGIDSSILLLVSLKHRKGLAETVEQWVHGADPRWELVGRDELPLQDGTAACFTEWRRESDTGPMDRAICRLEFWVEGDGFWCACISAMCPADDRYLREQLLRSAVTLTTKPDRQRGYPRKRGQPAAVTVPGYRSAAAVVLN